MEITGGYMRLTGALVLLTLAELPLPASAWNIPAHFLYAAITYQVLSQEGPHTIEKVKALLEKHPWYANQWQARLQDVPVTERDLAGANGGLNLYLCHSGDHDQGE